MTSSLTVLCLDMRVHQVHSCKLASGHSQASSWHQQVTQTSKEFEHCQLVGVPLIFQQPQQQEAHKPDIFFAKLEATTTSSTSSTTSISTSHSCIFSQRRVASCVRFWYIYIYIIYIYIYIIYVIYIYHI